MSVYEDAFFATLHFSEIFLEKLFMLVPPPILMSSHSETSSLLSILSFFTVSGVFLASLRRIQKKKKHESTAERGRIPRAAHRPVLQDEIFPSGIKINDISDGGIMVHPIGRIRSIFRNCVGTPRQGWLAPHARGWIELAPSNTDMIDGLDEYSHIWIVFLFHLNTKGRRNKVPTKISPPALGGTRKVGVCATRSPHRLNPIGITLAKLEKIEYSSKNRKVTRIYVSGLDLVDETPVVDIKPYVHVYDSMDHSRIPPWVSKGLQTMRSVQILETADQDLQSILSKQQNNSSSGTPMLDFYGPPYESFQEGMDALRACIVEVLAVDVRSGWQTQKVRQGKSQAQRSSRIQSSRVIETDDKEIDGTTQWSTQQIDRLLIQFEVRPASTLNRTESLQSGAEDEVIVHQVQLLQI